MICPRCGTQPHKGARFCPKCGASLDDVMPMDEEIMQSGKQCNGQYQYGQNYNNQQYNRPPKKKNNFAVMLVIIISLVLLVIMAVVGYMTYTYIGIFKDDTPPSPMPSVDAILTPSPSPTTSPIPTPVSTQMPTLPPIDISTPVPVSGNMPSNNTSYVPAVKNPSYNTLKNSVYGFSCAYPTHFIDYDDGSASTLWAGCTSDGRARETIAVSPIGNETVSSSFDSYVASHPGTITYQTKGSDYYAISVRNGDKQQYKYCKFKNGNMYWFEFMSPCEELPIYSNYVDYVYNSITYY